MIFYLQKWNCVTLVLFYSCCNFINHNIDFVLQGDSPYGQKEAYIKLEQLGEGSYATVFKGYSK